MIYTIKLLKVDDKAMNTMDAAQDAVRQLTRSLIGPKILVSVIQQSTGDNGSSYIGLLDLACVVRAASMHDNAIQLNLF